MNRGNGIRGNGLHWLALVLALFVVMISGQTRVWGKAMLGEKVHDGGVDAG